ncbi:hypothetical protein BDD43_3386 [Mucilaginibacter gracilis]|uniref:Lipoprotein n=1 Tax=Mucilaginibacter gracilis TaxID=423350 RepID=A0A495J4B8_9SPHI|nr:hypothetical protein [Mucilaginibacter gracilis]RKR83184.1 hypothetical protein BDD43_3386 [Mucilaginibacter gracilis]
MFKARYTLLLVLTFALAACRTVKKTESKTSDTLNSDSTKTAFKRSLSDVNSTNTNAEITTVEFEYPAITPEQKAQGQTEPKPRVKKVTKAIYNKAQAQVKTDDINTANTNVKKREVKKVENIKVEKKGGFPFWILIPILVGGGIFLYFRYGNLFALAKKLFTK